MNSGLVGASPDALVLDEVTKKMIGLCEFKAPVHRLYADIPRQYMVQMQGQMALTGNTYYKSGNFRVNFIFVNGV